jgi:hypothetical protein
MPVTYDSERSFVLVDYTNLKADELVAEADRVHKEARSHLTGKRVKVLVDVRGVMMSSEAVRALKESTRDDKAMIEKTAIVGITGVKRILADAIARFSGTDTKYFDTKEEAMEWLARP